MRVSSRCCQFWWIVLFMGLFTVPCFAAELGTALLDDFSTLRSPWQPYIGPQQVGSVENGMYKLVASTPSSDGYGL